MKVCNLCNIEKDDTLFHKRKDSKDGLRATCKECQYKKQKAYREANKEKIETYQKEYGEKNKEKLSKYIKEYYTNNDDEIKERSRKYHTKNKESIKQRRKVYYDKNSSIFSDKNKEYRTIFSEKIKKHLKTPSSRLSQRIARNKRKSQIVSSNDNTITKHSLNELLIKQNNKCYYCKCTLKSDKHLDHYIPLSKGGVNSINNVVWSCPSCNLSKSAKII